MDKNYLKKNEFTVIGTLVDVDLKTKESRKNQTYISGDITLEVGKDNLVEIKLFSFQFVNGTTRVNKFFETYQDLENRVGERIKVNGNIDERRFYDENNNQLVSFNYNNGRFINDVKADEKDVAEFEFSGYVEKTLRERLDKEDNLLHYELVMAQANYNNEKPVVVKLAVPKSERKAIDYMQTNYERGVTVTVKGEIRVVTEEVQKTEETAFGEDITKTFTNSFKTYDILSGTEPVDGKGQYSARDIRDFAEAYEDEGVKLQREAKNRTESNSNQKGNTASSLI